MIALYGCATLAVTVLSLFARQNRKEGWKRERPENAASAWSALFSSLGVAMEEPTPAMPMQTGTLTPEEQIGFSAQMLKLRAALGNGTPVTQNAPVAERELVHQ